MVTKEEVIEQLDEVEDPELDLSIVELGLVYDVRFEEKEEGTHAEVDLTLTDEEIEAMLNGDMTAEVEMESETESIIEEVMNETEPNGEAEVVSDVEVTADEEPVTE